MGILWLAVGRVFMIEGAENEDRVECAGGSSRVLIDVGWLGGLADLLLDCLTFRGVAVGFCAVFGPPCWTDAFLGGAIFFDLDVVGEDLRG